MPHIPRNLLVAKALGPPGLAFVEAATDAITRLLPHVAVTPLAPISTAPTSVTRTDAGRTLLVTFVLPISGSTHTLQCQVQRLTARAGVGAVQRAMHPSEHAICLAVAREVEAALRCASAPDQLPRLLPSFDELVVARHLSAYHTVTLDLRALLQTIRELAEQSYENKALSFACIVDTNDKGLPPKGAAFPRDFLAERKRFRLLSDGYQTAYEVSAAGAVRQLLCLPDTDAAPPPRSFFPEWTRDFALNCGPARLGISLTRQGDVLVFDGNTPRFTYRFGQWQYWNHTHLVDLLRSRARVQRVPTAIVARLVNALYRVSLDVAFRRTGGLFVVLRNQASLGDIVRAADRMRHRRRPALEAAFDDTLVGASVQSLPRPVLLELAAMDGAVVVDNNGRLMAYGAILAPKRTGKVDAAEGSRTKAAIGASHYGLAVKISSDGDISMFAQGERFVSV
jgi:hypothetical protein